MRLYLLIFTLYLISTVNNNVISKEIGQTEITADGGIEVFQNEKYYVLKENVIILSDSFELRGDEIKIFFNKDLYDIKNIISKGEAILISNMYGINGSSDFLSFDVTTQEIILQGKNSKLISSQMEMISDNSIKVNNSDGNFTILGPDSMLITSEIFIKGYEIEGEFNNNNDQNEIVFLKVKDDKSSYIKINNTEMYSKIAEYNKNNSIIELFTNVKIIKDGETISGDYGFLDTNENSYKVKSGNSNKVKIIISNTDE